MRIGWINRLVMAGLLAVSLGGQAKAQLIYNNLNESSTGQVIASEVQWLGQKFTWSTSQQEIRVDIAMQYFAVGNPAFKPVVEIWSDNGGSPTLPSASLFSLSPVSGLSEGFLVTNTFSGSANSLVSGTNYWVVLRANQAPSGVNDNLFWRYTVSTNGTGSGFTTDNARYETGAWGNDPVNPYQMQVQAVPEPSSFVLAGLGLGAMGFIRRRMKKKQAEVEETPAV